MSFCCEDTAKICVFEFYSILEAKANFLRFFFENDLHFKTFYARCTQAQSIINECAKNIN